MHSGRKNHYTLEMEGKVIKLEPLEPNEVLKEQVNLRASLKNTTRKSEDEREKIERSKGEKSDNSRVEKGEENLSEESELSQEKREEIEKKVREKKEGKQKIESEDLSYSNVPNFSTFSSYFVSCEGTLGEENLKEQSKGENSSLENLEEQGTFSRESMGLIEQDQRKENLFEEFQGMNFFKGGNDGIQGDHQKIGGFIPNFKIHNMLM
ncbi:uncharacterized protein LOC132053528 [Lycium ferocissimum]|uniref:uncharacterized protein LOC132053528 n=1 Tax=Lycium ferocissimum TaxID=112874 RepID=UPI00281693F6|nr:uncharacterized protein LOC132053528 [Lycium ferocissimum]